MRVYLDSGVLVKLYVKEPGSAEVAAIVNEASALLLSALQILELKTALKAAAGRGLLRSSVVEDTLKQIDADVHEGVYDQIYPDWEAVYAQATDYSRLHTGTLLCRTIDILHVALAASEGAEVFVSADKRQLALAEKVGLTVRTLP